MAQKGMKLVDAERGTFVTVVAIKFQQTSIFCNFAEVIQRPHEKVLLGLQVLEMLVGVCKKQSLLCI